jgi:hypothetical protein
LAIGLWVPKINLGPSPISFLLFSSHTLEIGLCTRGIILSSQGYFRLFGPLVSSLDFSLGILDRKFLSLTRAGSFLAALFFLSLALFFAAAWSSDLEIEHVAWLGEDNAAER